MKSSRVKSTFRLAICVLITCLFPYGQAQGVNPKKTANYYQPWKSWTSDLHRDHQLAGRIWSTRKGIFLTPRQLADELARQDFILLGEIHDNRDHHNLQAWLIRNISWYDRRPVIVWEMIDLEKQAELSAFTEKYETPVAKLGETLDWSSRGWPAWTHYLPIAEAAFQYRLKMIAGDASRDDIKSVSRNGIKSIGQEREKELYLSPALGSKLNTDLINQLRESHCGLLPEAALKNMSDVQRFRDAVMAEQMVTAGRKAGAVLIAGAGHVRTDRAVPIYIKRRMPEAGVASLIFLEISPDMDFAEDAAPRSPDGTFAADYIWFTPKAKRPDQCEQLKKHFSKKARKKKE